MFGLGLEFDLHMFMKVMHCLVYLVLVSSYAFLKLGTGYKKSLQTVVRFHMLMNFKYDFSSVPCSGKMCLSARFQVTMSMKN